MIEALISSKTRIKLLLKFFVNGNTTAYLRGLESEFGESSNAIRVELNRFERAGLLSVQSEGNKKVFFANQKHPLFKEIQSIVRKHIGIDHIIQEVAERLGEIEQVFLSGKFANGQDSNIIDLIFIGKINKGYLVELIEKVERLIRRKIRYLIYETELLAREDWKNFDHEPVLMWSKE